MCSLRILKRCVLGATLFAAAAACHAEDWLGAVRTTDGATFEHNLDARIAALQVARQRSRAFDPEQAGELARLLYARSQLRIDPDSVGEAIKVLEEGGDAPANLVLRARLLLDHHRFDAAAAALERASSQLGENADILALKYEVSLRRGDLELAQRQIDRALAHGGDGALYARKAVRLRVEGDCEQADKVIDSARDHINDPSPLPVALLNLERARIKDCLNRPAEARQLLLAAHRRLPGFVPVLDGLAANALGQGNNNEARGYLEKAVAISPSPMLRYALASVQPEPQREQTLGQAEQGFLRLAKRYPQAYAADVAGFYYARERYRDAATAIANLPAEARSLNTALLAVNIQMELGADLKALVALLDAGRATNQYSMQQYCTLAGLYQKLGQWDKAAEAIGQVHKRSRRECGGAYD